MYICWQSNVLLFNMLSRLVIAFLPRSKRLLISWLQSPSAVILEPKKIKSITLSIVSPSTCHGVMGRDAMIFIFWILSFKPAFSLCSFTFCFIIIIIIFYCSGFCHTLKWNSHGFTCVPHPDSPSHLPLHPIPLSLPSAPGPSACLMHPTWAGALSLSLRDSSVPLHFLP